MPRIKIRIGQESDEEAEAKGLMASSQSKEKIAVASAFAHQAINTGKQIVNYRFGTVGVREGNYIKQEQINQATEIIGDLSTVGLGFAAGGWVGGIVAIAGVTTKQIFKAIDFEQDVRQKNIESEYLAIRSGNTTKNGSRGTEN